jgi:hypothetical protein
VRSTPATRFRPPPIELSDRDALLTISHGNKRQLKALQRSLDGSDFAVKAIGHVAEIGPGQYILLAKLRRTPQGS